MDIGTSIGTFSKGQHYNISSKLRNLTGYLDDLEVQLGSSGFKESYAKGSDKTFSLSYNVPFTKLFNTFTDVSTSCVVNFNTMLLGNFNLNEQMKGIFMNYEHKHGNIHAYLKNSNH